MSALRYKECKRCTKMNTAKCKGTHTVPLLDALAQLAYKTLLGTKKEHLSYMQKGMYPKISVINRLSSFQT